MYPARAEVLFVADFDEGAAPVEISSAGTVTTFGTFVTPSHAVHSGAEPALGNAGGSLKISYQTGATGGVLLNFGSERDLTLFSALSFWVRADSASTSKTFKLNLKRATAPAEPAFRPDVRNFMDGGLTTSWQKVVIPLSSLLADFTVDSSTPLSDVDALVFSFDSGPTSDIYIDDVLFHSAAAPVWVDNFDDGDEISAFANSRVDVFEDPPGVTNLTSEADTSQALSLPGSLRADYDFDGSPAFVLTDLILHPENDPNDRGADVSACDALSMSFLAGTNGNGKNLRISLKDEATGEVFHNSTVTLSNSWATSSMDLSGFAGLDDTAVDLVQIWFRKDVNPTLDNAAAFTAFIDNVKFIDSSSPTTPSVLQKDGGNVGNNEFFDASNAITFDAGTIGGDATLESVRFEHDGQTGGAAWTTVFRDTDTLAAGHAFTWVTAGMTPGTDYQVRAVAMDVAGNESAVTFTGVEVSPCGAPQAGDVTPPAITHTAVKNAAANQPLAIPVTVTDDVRVSGVTVFYRAKGETAYEQASFVLSSACLDTVTGSVSVPAAAVTTAGLEYYIRATDSINTALRASAASPLSVAVKDATKEQSVGTAGGTVTLADSNPSDGASSLAVPAGALGGSTAITFTQISAEAAPPGDELGRALPFAAFDLTPDRLTFARPASLTLLYPDADQDGFLEDPVTGLNTAAAEKDVRIFFHDGVSWVRLGGAVDAARNTVTAPIMHFTTFGVFPGAAPSEAQLKPPEKIITPAGSPGVNDAANFGGSATGAKIELYDVTGRRVRTLVEQNVWDGRDDGGEFVESGAYVYQAEIEGQKISGVITVAK